MAVAKSAGGSRSTSTSAMSCGCGGQGATAGTTTAATAPAQQAGAAAPCRSQKQVSILNSLSLWKRRRRRRSAGGISRGENRSGVCGDAVAESARTKGRKFVVRSRTYYAKAWTRQMAMGDSPSLRPENGFLSTSRRENRIKTAHTHLLFLQFHAGFERQRHSLQAAKQF